MADTEGGTARHGRWATASDGVALRWFEYGPAAGRPVMVCHGLAAGSIQFDADARHFARAGYRVIVPDLRGHGQSGRSGEGETYSIARMGADLIAVLDAAGAGACDYLGNSLGGILALDLVSRHPERFRTLAMFGTAPALGLPRAAGGVIPLGYRLMGKRLIGLLTARVTTPNPAARTLIAGLVSNFDPEVGKAIARRVARYDLSAGALGFNGPMLIIRCGKDVSVNRMLDRHLPALEARPGVAVVRLDAAGHCANLDQPERFRQVVLEFWARN